ncbi:unnamed protein product [Notodromas monacha]|uniref:RBR-type E3 ubiquitin transferase n=1 Tax=Notodromas monacha TaxID=399045 RepID=A0A7R9BTC1_9CRUS|nr:unnamed protein product [Notodromas monacha]CAG0921381.1 unnamed protein product [Notodromas monacha]
MGSSSSKLRKYMHNGDEFAAMQLYQSSPELRKIFNPNASYGESYSHNTALHYAAMHGMKHLLRTFLWELNGDPRMRNGDGQTSLHCACQVSGQPKSLSTQERRTACVLILLQWLKDPRPNMETIHQISDDLEKFDISSTDNLGNTCLHYAACSGLARAAEALVKRGASLFVTNAEGRTACDLAAEMGHTRVAHLLESFMVLVDYLDVRLGKPEKDDEKLSMELQRLRKRSVNTNGETGKEDTTEEELEEKGEELYRGLRAVDLQEAKDLLLVETSDMLNVPLFSAEILLRQHEWSRESLLEHWVENMAACCEAAGIQPPPQTCLDKSHVESEVPGAVVSEVFCGDADNALDEDAFQDACEICMNGTSNEKPFLAAPCGHGFCQDCWSAYLKCRIVDFGYPSQGSGIPCPAFECTAPVPAELVQRAVSPSVVKKYLQHDIQAFVESHPMIKWCPKPGCNRAVRIPNSLVKCQTSCCEADVDGETMTFTFSSESSSSLLAAKELKLSHAVDCGAGHYFCWECLGEAHAPLGCERWKEWLDKCKDVGDDEVASAGATAAEEAANSLWLVANSKPCPNCHSPIQKNDGCNHMKCSKCKHDFCWVCLDSWKRHSAKTGGYFHCTRVVAVAKATAGQTERLKEAAVRNFAARERARFLCHLAMFRETKTKLSAESGLGPKIRNKAQIIAAMVPVHVRSEVENLPSFRVVERKRNGGDKPAIPQSELLYFLDSALKEVLKCRYILCGAYAYGYYVEDRGYSKTVLDFLVNELKDWTEKLSSVLSGPYIQTPLSKIIRMTAVGRQRRKDLLCTVARGLGPPDTPPVLRRMGVGMTYVAFEQRRLSGFFGLDDSSRFLEKLRKDWCRSKLKKQAEDGNCRLNPQDPWIKDANGRHANWVALCDWDDSEQSCLSRCRAAALAVSEAVAARAEDLMLESDVPPPLPPKVSKMVERRAMTEDSNDADNEEGSVSSASPAAEWTVDALLKSLTIDAVDLKNFCPSGPAKDKLSKSTLLASPSQKPMAASQPSSPNCDSSLASAFLWPPGRREAKLTRSQPCSPRGLVEGGLKYGTNPRIRIVSHSESSQDLESETGIPKSPTLFIRSWPSSPATAVVTVTSTSGETKFRFPEKRAPRRRRTVLGMDVRGEARNNKLDAFGADLFGLHNYRSASDSQCIHQISGAEASLSSVLLVEESTLSSDDFHEALFLTSKRKKSRKTRERHGKRGGSGGGASGEVRRRQRRRRSSLGAQHVNVDVPAAPKSLSSGDLVAAAPVPTCA